MPGPDDAVMPPRLTAMLAPWDDDEPEARRLVSDTGGAYIANLKALSEADQNYPKPSDDAKAPLSPLADRLRILLATIPPEVQRGGISLSLLQYRLRGRQGRACQAGELGAALRGLGYKRLRRWQGGDDGGYPARWYPPG